MGDSTISTINTNGPTGSNISIISGGAAPTDAKQATSEKQPPLPNIRGVMMVVIVGDSLPVLDNDCVANDKEQCNQFF